MNGVSQKDAPLSIFWAALSFIWDSTGIVWLQFESPSRSLCRLKLSGLNIYLLGSYGHLKGRHQNFNLPKSWKQSMMEPILKQDLPIQCRFWTQLSFRLLNKVWMHRHIKIWPQKYSNVLKRDWVRKSSFNTSALSWIICAIWPFQRWCFSFKWL